MWCRARFDVTALTDLLMSACWLYVQAAATPAYPLTFQVEYAQLRAAMLPALARVVQASCSFQTSPPPAIAASLAMTTGQEKHRCEHVLVQVCAFRFFTCILTLAAVFLSALL